MKRFLQNKKAKTALLIAVILTVLNLAARLAPFSISFPNVSGADTFLLSDTSARYLKTVDRSVEILYHVDGGRSAADRDLYSFLLQYQRENPLIRVELVDLSKEETAAADQTITVRAGSRSRTFAVSDFYYYYSNALQMSMTLEEYALILQSYSSSSLTEEGYAALMTYYGPAVMQAYYSGDANVTSAIRYVLSDGTPSVGIYTKGASGFNQLLMQALQQKSFGVEKLASMEGFGGNALILQLSSDLTEGEAAALRSYLAGGGKLFLTTAHGAAEIPNLLGVLADYGLSTPQGVNVVCDVMNGQYGSTFYASAGDHPITDGISTGFVAGDAHAILTKETEGVTHSVLLRSSESSRLLSVENTDQEPPAESYNLGVLAEKDGSAVLWLSMTFDSMTNAYSGSVNFGFAESAMAFLTDYEPNGLRISFRAIPSEYLGATTNHLIFWIVAFVAVIPLAVIAIGGVRVYVRRKR